MGLQTILAQRATERNTASAAQPGNRADGYSDDAARIISQFQRDIETSYRPNYDALRKVLRWAREEPGQTLNDLHAAYIHLTVN